MRVANTNQEDSWFIESNGVVIFIALSLCARENAAVHRVRVMENW